MLTQLEQLVESPKQVMAIRDKQQKALVSKWKKSGLLNEMSERDQLNMAQLLDTQAKQCLLEASRTATVSGAEEWSGVALPLIRRIFGEIAAKEFVSVQPINMPTGLVFWIEFKYGTAQPGFTTGAGKDSQNDSIWGVTDATKGTTAATGGLYDAGRFAYSINDYSSSALYASASITPTGVSSSITAANLTTDINFDTEFSASVVDADQIKKITVLTSNLSNADYLGARAFTISGTGIAEVYKRYTTVNAAKTQITFLVSGSGATASDLVVYYHKQPTDTTRGDFEELKTQEDPLDIPHLNMEFRQESITAKARRLKVQWTDEFAQDINAFHNIDVEAELSAKLGEYISMEIDLEVLDMLIRSAQTTSYWSARLGYEYNSTSQTFAQTSANASAYNQGTWFQTLGTKLNGVSNEINRLTMQQGATFMVCGPTVANIIESIPGYAANTDGTKSQFAMGVQKIGMVNNRWQVYKNPYMKENIILMGYKGGSYLDTGAVYSPYIPLIMSPIVLDPDNLQPRRGAMTRYAKKLLRPEYYGIVYVEGLHTV